MYSGPALPTEMARAAATEADGRFGRFGSGLAWFVGVPLEHQTYLNLCYVLLAFPLGLAYFVFLVVGLSVGLGLAIVLVGIPVLAITVALALGLAGFERWLTTTLLPVDVEPRTDLAGDRGRDKLWSLVTDYRTWTAVLYLPVKFVFGLVSFVVAVTGFSTGLSMLALPLYHDRAGLYVGVVTDRAPEIHQTLYLGWNYLLVGFEAVFTVGYWEITTFSSALAAAAFGVVIVLATFHALNALARISGWVARVLLEDGYDPFAVVVRSEGPQ